MALEVTSASSLLTLVLAKASAVDVAAGSLAPDMGATIIDPSASDVLDLDPSATTVAALGTLATAAASNPSSAAEVVDPVNSSGLTEFPPADLFAAASDTRPVDTVPDLIGVAGTHPSPASSMYFTGSHEPLSASSLSQGHEGSDVNGMYKLSLGTGVNPHAWYYWDRAAADNVVLPQPAPPSVAWLSRPGGLLIEQSLLPKGALLECARTLSFNLPHWNVERFNSNLNDLCELGGTIAEDAEAILQHAQHALTRYIGFA